MTTLPVHVIGGGLAGSEAAWQIAEAGVPVVLHEMRPVRGTDAHQTEGLAELVCSNSFRADDWTGNAVGLLHAEMRRLGSIIMSLRRRPPGPGRRGAGGGSRRLLPGGDQARLEAHPLITIVREEIAGLPPADWDQRGGRHRPPDLGPALADAILGLTGEGQLSFFDAIAPIVHTSTASTWTWPGGSRATTRKGPAATPPPISTARWTRTSTRPSSTPCWPGPRSEFKEWENVPYFDGCLPIEVMAERGRETLTSRADEAGRADQ